MSDLIEDVADAIERELDMREGKSGMLLTDRKSLERAGEAAARVVMVRLWAFYVETTYPSTSELLEAFVHENNIICHPEEEK